MAIYNNGYPVTYQNPYYQQPQIYQQPTQTNTFQNVGVTPQNVGIIWVQGEVGAKSYPIAPNTTVPLWDSEQKVIYLKSADASGMPSIKTLDYTIRGAELQNTTLNELDDKFISRDEFDALKNKMENLQGEINKLKPRKKEEKHNG